MLALYKLKRRAGTRKAFDHTMRTVCQECGGGCGLIAYLKENRIVDIQGDESHPISRGRLCARGTAFVQGIGHPERITLPASRNRLQGAFEASDNWEKALDHLAKRLRRMQERHVPEALMIGCDPAAGFDFYIGARRFAALWKTPHVYSPLYGSSTGNTGNTFFSAIPCSDPCSEWIDSGTLFMINTDLAVSHPVAFGWALDARQQGAKIIAADTRFTATMSKADRALVIHPGTGNDLGLMVMKMLLAENRHNPQAAPHKDSPAWQQSYADMSAAGAESHIGLAADEIKQLMRFLADHAPVTLITGSQLALEPHYTIWPALAAVMGWTGASGGGWYPLDSAWPPVDPAADLDEMPTPPLTGGPWGHPCRADGEYPESEVPTIRTLIAGGDWLGRYGAPFGSRAKDMDLTVYYGRFPDQTRSSAHTVLPAAMWAETDVLCISNDGVIQWAPRIVPPRDACRSGLGFWSGLARRLGWETHFPWETSEGDIDRLGFYEWMMGLNPHTAALNIETIVENQQPVAWAPSGLNGPETESATNSAAPIDFPAAPALLSAGVPRKADEAFPLWLYTDLSAEGGVESAGWYPWLAELMPDEMIHIHPAEASTLGIATGDDILLTGARVKMSGRAYVTRTVPRRTVWASPRISTRIIPAGDGQRVLVHKSGQTPDEARKLLKVMAP